MTDIITFFLNFNYDICLAPDNLWTLEEAVDYFASFIANRDSWYATEDAYKAFLRIKEQLSSAVIHSIEGEEIHLFETSQDKRNNALPYDFKKSTVVPLEVINWAVRNNLPIPEQFEKYAARKNGQKSGTNKEKALRRSTIHHEKTRAVAEMLWSTLPHLSINEMARRPEITQFGCEGNQYNTRTIARWLATLKAVRRPGRVANA